MLRTLNKDFQQIAMDYHIPCLSFGETEKSVLGAKLKMMIVPPESSGMYSNMGSKRYVVYGEEKEIIDMIEWLCLSVVCMNFLDFIPLRY